MILHKLVDRCRNYTSKLREAQKDDQKEYLENKKQVDQHNSKKQPGDAEMPKPPVVFDRPSKLWSSLFTGVKTCKLGYDSQDEGFDLKKLAAERFKKKRTTPKGTTPKGTTAPKAPTTPKKGSRQKKPAPLKVPQSTSSSASSSSASSSAASSPSRKGAAMRLDLAKLMAQSTAPVEIDSAASSPTGSVAGQNVGAKRTARTMAAAASPSKKARPEAVPPEGQSITHLHPGCS
jgi:hypothetical protein